MITISSSQKLHIICCEHLFDTNYSCCSFLRTYITQKWHDKNGKPFNIRMCASDISLLLLIIWHRCDKSKPLLQFWSTFLLQSIHQFHFQMTNLQILTQVVLPEGRRKSDPITFFWLPNLKLAYIAQKMPSDVFSRLLQMYQVTAVIYIRRVWYACQSANLNNDPDGADKFIRVESSDRDLSSYYRQRKV